MNKHQLRACIITVLVWSCIGCVKDPVTGRSTLNFMSENQEIQLGASSHDSVVLSMGLYDEGNWQAYIDKIGQEIAGISHRSHLTYNFNVVDSPVVNAFALPGGWVYFTRGILAHFNSEDELAGVMGHEVGHVVARHSAEQYSRQQLATLGLGVALVLSEDLRRFGGYAQMGLGLLFLKFSRNQESESDMLGVQYTTTLGYDSHEMAGFFRTIARLSAQHGQSTPNFLSTHPNPLNREKRVHDLTDKYRGEIEYKPRNNNRNTYLRRLEGMVFGEDPRNGYLDSDRNAFYHPRWDIQFPVPAGWKMQRNALQIQFVPESKDAGMMFMRHPKATDHGAAADEFASGESIKVVDRKSVRVNGFSALRLVSEVAGQNQGQNLGVVSYFIKGNGNKVFVGHGFTEANKFSTQLKTFERTLKGFGRLTYQPAKRKQPVRLRIKPARRNGTLESALKALGTKQDQLATLSLLNGLELQDPVKRGYLLKTLSK